jgi:group II intron reverse transcriptase/maturase
MTSTHEFLEIVHKCGKRNYPIRKVFRRMLDVDLFLHAYGKLYSNKGSLTKGVEGDEGMDGMSLERIHSLITELRNGRFRWKPSRRVYIPKSNGQQRPIGIPSWKDKLVQEVIRLILEAYYEPQFSDHSHGFRPLRSCHTALEEVQRWRGTRWWIEGDIKGCFDNIDHNILVDILKRSFQDTKFIKLIWGLLKSGYMEDWKYKRTYSGTPQGGVVSPILANILLNELDQKIHDLIEKWHRGKIPRSNPEWVRKSGNARYNFKQGNLEKARQYRQTAVQLPSTDQFDPNFRRLRYVRYADDFLLGFIGSKAEADEIKQEIGATLAKLGLTLSDSKTLITHARTGRARFLGYEIKVSWDNSKQCWATRNGTRFRTRSINGQVQLLVPRSTIVRWLGYYSSREKPMSRNKYRSNSDFDITAHFGSEWRGLVNYYTLAMNVAILSEVYWMMSRSYQATLASKHECAARYIRRKYQTREDGIRCWIVRVEKRNKPGEYLTAKFGGIPLKVQKRGNGNDIAYIPYLSNTELVQRLQADTCELCGATGAMEVHHVNALKDVKGKEEWKQRMIALRRKTLVVCPSCHKSIHQN